MKTNKTNNTGNLDYTRYRVKTNKTNNTGNLDYTRYSVKTNKTKTLATLITQDTGWRQTKQITLATLITQDTGWRQTKQRHWQPWLHKIQCEEKQNKDTGNLDYTRYSKQNKLATLITQDTVWRQTKQRHWQPWLHKIQGEDKQNKDTEDYKQNKDTGNLDYTRYRVKTNKTKTLTLATLITQDTGWRQTKQRHWQPWLHKIQGEDKQNKDTGNLDYTRYRVKTNKTKTLATLITQDTGWR